MRCLTLADALREQCAEVMFICRDLSGFSAKMVVERGHELRILPAPKKTDQVLPDRPPHAKWLEVTWEEDAEQTEKILQSVGSVDWLVVDHYALDFRWEKQLRSKAHRILVVDDLADRRHDCDLLVDQTLAASTKRYAELVPSRCRLLIGPQYAMLRPQFAEYREKAIKKRKQTNSIQKILITMGGTDPYNITGTVLQGLNMIEDCDIETTVIMGASAPHLEAVKEQARCMTLPVKILCDVRNMAEIMVDHDLCIGSGGMTSWERCVMGLPSLTITSADNQKHVLHELAAAGVTKYIGLFDSIKPKDIHDSIHELSINMPLYHYMSEASRRICDGKGIKRITSSIYANSLDLRPAKQEDCHMYWKWANDPTVRKQSFSPEPIPYEKHCKWFHAKLFNPNVFLFVGFIGKGMEIGQVRFECENSIAFIDISIDKKFRGFGLGRIILEKSIILMKSKNKNIKFSAKILKNNFISQKIFISNGFTVDKKISRDLNYIQYSL
jgi:UDP-2,4-diacetamido-2,4,6-trideoxy-beta-L-altropyranose hydrolase